MVYFVVKMRAKWRDQNFQSRRQVHRVGMDFHINIVRFQQGFIAFAQVEVLGVEVGTDFVDVAQRRAWTCRGCKHTAFGIGPLVELAYLGISVVSRGVMGLVHDQ